MNSVIQELFVCLISLTWIGSFSATPVCQSSLGMEDGSISDVQLSASSAHSALSDPLSGRLNGNKGYGAWCPSQDNRWYRQDQSGPHYDQFYQVNFLGKPIRISAVGIQGRSKNHGVEKVEAFYVNYTLMSSEIKTWVAFHDWRTNKPKEFKGNTDDVNITKMNYLKPPIIADIFRLIPEIYKVNQVCLRMELYGCQLTQDLMSYTVSPGNAFKQDYNLTDVIFDGVVTPTKLISGLGFLTDGVLASEDFIIQNGYGWIGWHSKVTRSPFIKFDFLKLRVFRTVTFHSNIRTRSGIQLFKAVKIEFFDHANPHAQVMHYNKDMSSGYRWMNYNVTVDMCLNYAKILKMQFTFSGEWMLISEVTFDSDSVIENRLPTPECSTQPPVIVVTVAEENTTTTSNLTFPGSLPGSSSSGLDIGVIIGIVCGVILIILLLILFICYWCYRRKRHLQNKPSFYNFIRWELKPYPSGYRSAVRVSRLGSSGEEEKNYTFRRQPGHEEARREAQANGMDGVCPIYASIENPDDMDKTAGLSPNKSISPSKGGKPKNKPPPLPLQSIQSPPGAHYAIPDSPKNPYLSPVDNSEPISPLAMSPDQYTRTPPPSSVPPKPDVVPDVFYAEPDTPAPPKIIAGYSEPIDAVIPGDGVFPNPVYEEIYSEPYQGVSGTSLYANPSTDLKVKHDNFKEFPRDKLIFKEKIGDGQFGEVHLGEAEGLGDILAEEFSNNRRVLVAIKRLKPDVDKNIKSDFFKEVKIMAGIQHENVIRLLGVCKDDPMCMIVEYMVNGDLNQFLKEREMAPGKGINKEKVLTYQALIYMASQIAAGMKYMASLKFVHRDLATRNCLVGHSYTVKIADFGMSRHLYSKHYYRVQGRVILPIRWMAPECILQGKFTSESDVWAFAVTLWEILTLAAEYPYDDLSDEQVIENIQRMFFRPDDPNIIYLGRPSICPSDVYDMMKLCWQKDPTARPCFKALYDFFKKRVRLSEMAI